MKADPLVQAIRNNDDAAIADCLLAKNYQSSTTVETNALLLCLHGGRREMALRLLDGGFPVQTRKGSETPLHVAAARGYHDVVQKLLDLGANILATDKEGNTSLHWAVNRMEMVELLLGAGAPMDAVNRNGNTALHEAVRREYPSALMLIKRGAKSGIINQDGHAARDLASTKTAMRSIDRAISVLEKKALDKLITETESPKKPKPRM